MGSRSFEDGNRVVENQDHEADSIKEDKDHVFGVHIHFDSKIEVSKVEEGNHQVSLNIDYKEMSINLDKTRFLR